MVDSVARILPDRIKELWAKVSRLGVRFVCSLVGRIPALDWMANNIFRALNVSVIITAPEAIKEWTYADCEYVHHVILHAGRALTAQQDEMPIEDCQVRMSDMRRFIEALRAVADDATAGEPTKSVCTRLVFLLDSWSHFRLQCPPQPWDDETRQSTHDVTCVYENLDVTPVFEHLTALGGVQLRVFEREYGVKAHLQHADGGEINPRRPHPGQPSGYCGTSRPVLQGTGSACLIRLTGTCAAVYGVAAPALFHIVMDPTAFADRCRRR